MVEPCPVPNCGVVLPERVQNVLKDSARPEFRRRSAWQPEYMRFIHLMLAYWRRGPARRWAKCVERICLVPGHASSHATSHLSNLMLVILYYNVSIVIRNSYWQVESHSYSCQCTAACAHLRVPDDGVFVSWGFQILFVRGRWHDSSRDPNSGHTVDTAKRRHMDWCCEANSVKLPFKFQYSKVFSFSSLL